MAIGNFESNGLRCKVPNGTTITFLYSSWWFIGGGSNQSISNGASIGSNDIEPIEDNFYFIKNNLEVPKEAYDISLLQGYPRTYVSNDEIPNLYLNPADMSNIKCINNGQKQVVTVKEKTYLKDLLNKHQGENIH